MLSLSNIYQVLCPRPEGTNFFCVHPEILTQFGFFRDLIDEVSLSEENQIACEPNVFDPDTLDISFQLAYQIYYLGYIDLGSLHLSILEYIKLYSLVDALDFPDLLEKIKREIPTSLITPAERDGLVHGPELLELYFEAAKPFKFFFDCEGFFESSVRLVPHGKEINKYHEDSDSDGDYDEVLDKLEGMQEYILSCERLSSLGPVFDLEAYEIIIARHTRRQKWTGEVFGWISVQSVKINGEAIEINDQEKGSSYFDATQIAGGFENRVNLIVYIFWSQVTKINTTFIQHQTRSG